MKEQYHARYDDENNPLTIPTYEVTARNTGDIAELSTDPLGSGGGDSRSAPLGVRADTRRQAAPAPSAAPGGDVFSLQNQQFQKEQFLARQQNTITEVYLNNQLEFPLSIYEIKAGTIIPFQLITGITFDLPASFLGHITEDVYAQRGSTLLVPKGSKILGRYDSNISWGQVRVLATANRILLPNGTSVSIDGMQVIAPDGTSGIPGEVDTHLDDLIAALAIIAGIDSGKVIVDATLIAAISAIPGLSAVANAISSNSLNDETFTSITNQLTERYLSQQPTIIVDPGESANVFIDRDIILTPYVDRTEI